MVDLVDCIYIGSISYTICLLTHLTSLQFGGNPGLTCAPSCVSSVSSRAIPSAVCVYPQDTGLCGLIAATYIHSQSGYSQWSCTTGGAALSIPCYTPVWPGVSCNGTDVVGINLASLGITGIIMLCVLCTYLFSVYLRFHIGFRCGLPYLSCVCCVTICDMC